jgi:hypothetical protein
MGTHEPTSRHEGQERRPTSQEDGHAGVVEVESEPAADGHVEVVQAKVVQPLETDESLLPPSPSEYSIEVAFPWPPWVSIDFRPPTKAPPAAPPAAAQRAPGQGASKPESRRVVIVPLSFARSAERIWKLVGLRNETWRRILLGIAAVVLIGLAWCVVLCWYLIWGTFLVSYGLIRRGSRKRKHERYSTAK